MAILSTQVLQALSRVDDALSAAGEPQASRQRAWASVLNAMSEEGRGKLRGAQHIVPGNWVTLGHATLWEVGWPMPSALSCLIAIRPFGSIRWAGVPELPQFDLSDIAAPFRETAYKGWEEAACLAPRPTSSELDAEVQAIVSAVQEDAFVERLTGLRGWQRLSWRWGSVAWLHRVWVKVKEPLKEALRRALADGATHLNDVPLWRGEKRTVVPASTQTLLDPATHLYYPGEAGLAAFQIDFLQGRTPSWVGPVFQARLDQGGAIRIDHPLHSPLAQRMISAWWDSTET